jgi:hypothetical protein
VDPAYRATYHFRAAHNSIYYLHPNENLICLRLPEGECFRTPLGTIIAGLHYQRAWFEGAKKPIGSVLLKNLPRPTCCLSRRRLSRRHAKLNPLPPTSQYLSMEFLRIFSQAPKDLETTGFHQHPPSEFSGQNRHNPHNHLPQTHPKNKSKR